MKITDNKTEDNQAVLTIEMSPEEVSSSFEKTYKRLAKRYHVPGFRKGKAPRNVLERHIGKENFIQEAMEEIIPHACTDAVKEQGITPYSRPTVEVIKKDPLIFKATIPLPPKVDLGDYKKIRVKQVQAKLKKSDVDSMMEDLRHQRASWEPVERPVSLNDLLIVSIEGKIDNETVMDYKEKQFIVRAGSENPVPGFAEQLVGMEIGKEKKFKLNYPEHFAKKELAGKDRKVSFTVKVKEIKEEKLPALDDDFAKGIDSSFKTIADLKKRVSENLKMKLEEQAKQDFEDKVIDAAVKVSKVSYPPVLVEVEVERMLNRQLEQIRLSCRNDEDFEEKIKQLPLDKLKEQYKPLASDMVKRSLVIGQIAINEKIEVSDKDIDSEIELMLEKSGADKEKKRSQLNIGENREQIKRALMVRKTIEMLKSIATSPVKKKTAKKKEVAK